MQVAEQEQQQINELVAEAEAKSGAQVLIVIVDKADPILKSHGKRLPSARRSPPWW
jgi:uncharacterized membrane protein YgcG